ISGILAYLEDNEITVDGLMEHIKAPDFPTGGTIYGLNGVRQAFETGRGRVVVRGKAEIEVLKTGRERIIVTEIPYQVNKSNLIVKIADMVNNKKIEGIADIRDESDRKGMRIVFELKKDSNANVVLSKLYKYSALQSSYGVNNICLVNGRPQLLNLKSLIEEFVKFRLEVVERRARYDLAKAEKRAHILKGLLAALDRLDAIISLIRASKNGDEAKKALMNFDFTPKQDALDKFSQYLALEGNRLSEEQAKAILDMRLQRLTGLERERLIEEFKGLIEKIEDLKDILAREERRISIIKEELTEVEEKYGGGRNTEITHAEGEISIEDMISNEKVMISISHLGYIKRTLISELKEQRRGGRGSQAAKTRDGDFTEHIFSSYTHNYLLLFTNKGRCHWLKVYEIPKGTKTSKGRAIQNILQLPDNEKIKAYIPIADLSTEDVLQSHSLIFASKNGLVKKSKLKDYSRPRSGGINAITIREGDEIIEVKLTNGNNDIILGANNGKSIRFNENDVRVMGRMATGVKGMTLGEGEELIGMVCVDKDDPETTILTVAEKGIGKRTLLEEYRAQSRGGKGVKTMNITEKTGKLMGLKAVQAKDGLMITAKSGLTIRMAVDNISVSGRATQGVKLINLKNKDAIADLALIHYSEEDDNENETPDGENEEGTTTADNAADNQEKPGDNSEE
ncbi:MAG: DNA gyrase subunit A, partial [Saprospiraceae bacterium]|nr:DNA gyrase subunit A [Saprospiraceae bacterium]